MGNLPGLKITHNNLSHLCGETDAKEPGDDFFNMLVKCQVRARNFLQESSYSAAFLQYYVIRLVHH